MALCLPQLPGRGQGGMLRLSGCRATAQALRGGEYRGSPPPAPAGDAGVPRGTQAADWGCGEPPPEVASAARGSAPSGARPAAEGERTGRGAEGGAEGGKEDREGGKEEERGGSPDRFPRPAPPLRT